MSNQPPPPPGAPPPPSQPPPEHGQSQPPPPGAQGQPQSQQPGAQGQPQTVYVERAGSGLAILALVCGIFGLVIALIPILGIFGMGLGLVAFIVGLIARSKAKKGTATGKGIATAGIVLGVLAIALGIVGLVIVGDAFDQLDQEFQEIESELGG